MSTDLNVVTCLRPDQLAIQGFVAKQPDVSIDGPFEIEDADVAKPVLSVVSMPHWILQISVPAMAGRRVLRRTMRFASEIAQSYDGAAYDLQKDIVFWPKCKRKPSPTKRRPERIRLVELAWFLPARMACPGTCETFLSTLREIYPKCLPTRYGTFEPFQYRCSAEQPGEFVTKWEELSEIVTGGGLSWRATQPCFGGAVSFPDNRNDRRPVGAARCVKIYLSFDGRALREDQSCCAAVEELFRKLAQELQAFYAAGHVMRKVVADRNVWFDAKSEESPFPRTEWWMGIPPVPMWLLWFGGPYKDLVAEAAAQSVTVTRPAGVFLRPGAQPMDRDELRTHALDLPPNLLVRYDETSASPERMHLADRLKSIVRPGQDYERLLRQPVSAEHIPVLE